MKPRFFAHLPLCVLHATLFTAAFAAQSAPADSPVVAAPHRAEPQTVAAPPQTTAEQDATLLAHYQLALDQLASGATGPARVILEDSIRRYGPRPEVNLLLAYILQREGNINGALDATNQVAKDSSLAFAFSTQLQGTTPLNNVLMPNIMPGIGTPTTVIPVAVSSVAVSPVTLEGAPVTVAPQSNTSLLQTDARLTKLELAMMDMVNAERAKTGLGVLQWDEDLAAVARAHSAEMRDKNYFSHESPTPGLTTHLDRYRAAGHDAPRVIAENIFRAWGSPKQVGLSDIQGGHDALMQSPGHRANILYREITKIGIGVATNTKGDIWITQMFLRS